MERDPELEGMLTADEVADVVLFTITRPRRMRIPDDQLPSHDRAVRGLSAVQQPLARSVARTMSGNRLAAGAIVAPVRPSLAT